MVRQLYPMPCRSACKEEHSEKGDILSYDTQTHTQSCMRTGLFQGYQERLHGSCKFENLCAFFLDAKRRSFFLQFRQIHCTVRTKHPKIRSSQFMEKTRCEGTKKAGKKQQLTKPLETLQMDKLKIVRALLCVCVCFFLNSFFHRASMLFPIALFE